ncbi:hypothetical protein [Kitasatospora sp. NPDC057500]|uniref:hypothetical protein n=1 Tax=Kitasatospora sp. NPDC057500 TaxID=3346151 RepID=UPI0036BFD53B
MADRDLDDLPATWLSPERAEVLRLMAGLGPYGAEAGTPCSGDWCTCGVLSDECAARKPVAPGGCVA